VRAQVVVEGGEEETDVELSRGMRSADVRATKARRRVVGFIGSIGERGFDFVWIRRLHF
jgi:hypothetical protein